MEKRSKRLHINMNGLCADLAWISINKKKEKICGDFFYILEENNKHVLVLSDGMGSGVKANILSTMTAHMLSRMIAGGVGVRDAVATVAQTLPVCSVRQMAYATFTVLDFQPSSVYLLQYDNPDAILIHNGQTTPYPIYTSFLGEKELHESMLCFQEEDMLILMSDGITNAGMGETTNSGWGLGEVTAFCRKKYKKGMCAREMAYQIAGAGLDLNAYGVDDDMTVLVLRFCRPQVTNLMIGPPRNPENDQLYMKRFFDSPGRHVICGGTTAQIAAKYLGEKLEVIRDSGSEAVPSAMQLKGADYVTEGQITLEQLLEYCEEWRDDPKSFFTLKKSQDPAMKLLKVLFGDSTHINLFFGSADNSAQEAFELSLQGKQEKVEKLISYLEEQCKEVQISYWAV